MSNLFIFPSQTKTSLDNFFLSRAHALLCKFLPCGMLWSGRNSVGEISRSFKLSRASIILRINLLKRVALISVIHANQPFWCIFSNSEGQRETDTDLTWTLIILILLIFTYDTLFFFRINHLLPEECKVCGQLHIFINFQLKIFKYNLYDM